MYLCALNWSIANLTANISIYFDAISIESSTIHSNNFISWLFETHRCTMVMNYERHNKTIEAIFRLAK